MSRPPAFDEEDLDDSLRESDGGDGMAKLADFLYHLGLEKYYDAFEAQNIHGLQWTTAAQCQRHEEDRRVSTIDKVFK